MAQLTKLEKTFNRPNVDTEQGEEQKWEQFSLQKKSLASFKCGSRNRHKNILEALISHSTTVE